MRKCGRNKLLKLQKCCCNGAYTVGLSQAVTGRNVQAHRLLKCKIRTCLDKKKGCDVDLKGTESSNKYMVKAPVRDSCMRKMSDLSVANLFLSNYQNADQSANKRKKCVQQKGCCGAGPDRFRACAASNYPMEVKRKDEPR